MASASAVLRSPGDARCYADLKQARDPLRGSKAGPVSSPKASGGPPGSAEPAASPASQEGDRRGKVGPHGRYQAPHAVIQAGHRMARPAVISMNIIAEPYRGEPPKLPWTSWFTPKGWRERWTRLLGNVKSIYTLAKLRKNFKGWSLEGFKRDALATYEESCTALASGDRSRLRQCMTPGEFTNTKKQVEAREAGGWSRVAWSLARRPELRELEVVQARLLAFNPKDEKSAFAQLTVRIRAEHKFAAYDKKGQLVAGDPDTVLPVQDVWIFERSLKPGPVSRWRVAGRLSLPPVPPLKVGPLARLALLWKGRGASPGSAVEAASSPPTA